MPVYNGEMHLRESLDSILAQTYSSMEILAIDDASTDSTASILESYGPAIVRHRQERNLGIYDNANVGIDMANGEYTAIYHADDVYEPTIVERQVEFLDRHPDAGAVFCLDTFIDGDGREYGRLELPPEVSGGAPLPYATVLNALLTYKNRFFVCPTAMVRTKVYRELDGYRQQLYRNSSDLDMWLRIARRHAIGIIEDYLIRYRHIHGSSSQNYHHLRTDVERYFTILDDHLEEGGRAVATPIALDAYEAHRTEDGIMIAISHYIRDELPAARGKLAEQRARRLLRGTTVQRWRLSLLLAAFRILTRLPRSSTIADLSHSRWHDKSNRRRPPS